MAAIGGMILVAITLVPLAFCIGRYAFPCLTADQKAKGYVIGWFDGMDYQVKFHELEDELERLKASDNGGVIYLSPWESQP